MIYSYTHDKSLLEKLTSDQASALLQQCPVRQLIEMMDTLMETMEKYRTASNVTSYFEVSLLKMMAISDETESIAVVKPLPVVREEKKIEKPVEEPKPLSEFTATVEEVTGEQSSLALDSEDVESAMQDGPSLFELGEVPAQNEKQEERRAILKDVQLDYEFVSDIGNLLELLAPIVYPLSPSEGKQFQAVLEEAIEKATGQYGRFDDAVRTVDPRHE